MASDGAETMSAGSRRAVQQRRKRSRQSFVVVCDAQAASVLSPIAVVSASRPCTQFFRFLTQREDAVSRKRSYV